jgi:subtilase family serine protease
MRLSALAALLLPFAGCGGGSGSSTTGTDRDWTATTPVHVNQTRSTVPVGYTPAQLRHAYGFDKLTGTGVGQTIALVEVAGSPTLQSDLNAFSTKFSLPQTTVTVATPLGAAAKDAGWALETSLDVEWAHAIAPGAKLLVVVSPSASLSALLSCVDYAAAHATAVSMSWGGSEFNGETSYDSHFNKAGVTFTAASGDDGGGTEWPAASPYVIGVGGTTLHLDASGNRTAAETAWKDSAGGDSVYEARPTWQAKVQTSSKRAVPDVAYDADPTTGVTVYDTTPYSGASGWFEVGGTSAGTPQWAALVAVANGIHGGALSNVVAALYGLPYAADFTDITSGANSHNKAATGYDLVTGLGTPLAATLAPGL